MIGAAHRVIGFAPRNRSIFIVDGLPSFRSGGAKPRSALAGMKLVL
jgi:hypothetical protein